MHREYQTFISLLKLLFFFALATSISQLILVTSSMRNRAELSVSVLAIAVILIKEVSSPSSLSRLPCRACWLADRRCGGRTRRAQDERVGFMTPLIPRVCLVLMPAVLAYFARVWIFDPLAFHGSHV